MFLLDFVQLSYFFDSIRMKSVFVRFVLRIVIAALFSEQMLHCHAALKHCWERSLLLISILENTDYFCVNDIKSSDC